MTEIVRKIINIEENSIKIADHDGKMTSGTHLICNNLVNIKFMKSYNVIFCGACGLRLVFPSRITKVEDLKEFLEGKIVEREGSECKRYNILDIKKDE